MEQSTKSIEFEELALHEDAPYNPLQQIVIDEESQKLYLTKGFDRGEEG
jgi:hypothetical protein